jgi:hypothetical protein
MVEIIFWSMGMIIIGLPVGLSLFTIFLMLTASATDADVIYYGDREDQDDIDDLTKRL